MNDQKLEQEKEQENHNTEDCAFTYKGETIYGFFLHKNSVCAYDGGGSSPISRQQSWQSVVAEYSYGLNHP